MQLFRTITQPIPRLTEYLHSHYAIIICYYITLCYYLSIIANNPLSLAINQYCNMIAELLLVNLWAA